MYDVVWQIFTAMLQGFCKTEEHQGELNWKHVMGFQNKNGKFPSTIPILFAKAASDVGDFGFETQNVITQLLEDKVDVWGLYHVCFWKY